MIEALLGDRDAPCCACWRVVVSKVFALLYYRLELVKEIKKKTAWTGSPLLNHFLRNSCGLCQHAPQQKFAEEPFLSQSQPQNREYLRNLEVMSSAAERRVQRHERKQSPGILQFRNTSYWPMHTMYTTTAHKTAKIVLPRLLLLRKHSEQSVAVKERSGLLRLLLDSFWSSFGQGIAYLPLSLGVLIHLPRSSVGLSFQRFPHKEFQPPQCCLALHQGARFKVDQMK